MRSFKTLKTIKENTQTRMKITQTKNIAVILKYLDGMVTIDMIVKSNDNPTTYTVYLDDVKEIAKKLLLWV